MKKDFRNILKICPLLLGILVPIAFSAWVIDSSDRKEAPVSYQPSNLTEYIVSNTSGTNYIFEDINNTENGNGSGFYSNLTTDRSFQNIDGFHRNIYLGYSDGRTLTLDHNVVFTHTNNQIDYSESDFLNENTFTPKDGDGDSGTDGSYYAKYYSSVANAKDDKPSYISKYNYVTNYYRNNNSSHPLSYTNFNSDGTRETKTYAPKGYLYTIKLAGDIVIKKGSFLSIGAFVLSTNGGGEAGGIIQGNNVELDLNGHSITIEEGATLNAYGYIVDTKKNSDGSLKGTIYNHGTIYSPMVVCDYSGGGNTVGRAFSGVVPFSMFNMPYLSAKVYFYNTSKLLCPTALYASSTLSKIVCKIIGSDGDSFIQLEDSSSILIGETKNNRSTDQKIFYSGDDKDNSPTKEGFRCSLIFRGNIKINSLKLSIAMNKSVASVNASFDLAAFNFPIAPYYSFTIENNSKVTCPLTLEFYPGSTLLAKEGSEIVFLSSFFRNHYTVKIVGTTDYEIKKGTSYGGIIVPTELPPSNDNTYHYSSNYPYSFSNSWFEKYLRQEKALFVTKKPRINIQGIIKSGLSSSEMSKHILTGYIDVNSTNAGTIGSFKNHVFVKKEFNYVTAKLVNLSSIKFEGPGKSLSGAISQPLCDSNLKVINASKIDNRFDSSTTYDYLSGIYYCPNTGKKFVSFNDENKFVEVEEKTDSRCVMIEDGLIGTRLRYLYFRNLFVSAEQYDVNLFDDKGNLVTRNDDGTYTLSYYYSGKNDETFYIKNDKGDYAQAMNIGEGEYTVNSSIDGSTDYSGFLKQIKNKINNDSQEINLNGQTFNSIVFKQLGLATAMDFGTFKSVSFTLTGYPQLYEQHLFGAWYSKYDKKLSDATGDLKISYYTDFKTRLRFDNNFGSWVKTTNAK